MFKDLKSKIKNSAYNQNILNLIEVSAKHFQVKKVSKLLDIACNDGVYTKMYCEHLGVDFENAYGVDYNEDNLELLPRNRFFYHDIDLLKPLPFEDKSFDLIIMNQILEHLKNIAHIISEVNRVARNGCVFVLSVPNLAAWHNRICLVFGKQPLAIQGMDFHVRGFTKGTLKKYVSNYGFEYVDCAGGGDISSLGFLWALRGKVFA